VKHTKQLDLFPDLPSVTIDEDNFKLCMTCNHYKEKTFFQPREHGAGKSLRNECSKCSRDKAKVVNKLRDKHPKPTSKKYKCPCCKKTEKELKKYGQFQDRSVWVLDHNHLTDKFRGWICNNCNNGLGRLKDDVNILQNAMEYLKNNDK
jgi:hypothetical protein